MKMAILSGGSGWHVGDLLRAAAELGVAAETFDFRRVAAGTRSALAPLDQFDVVLVRTMPPGSLEQVVFRMDVLHRLQASGVTVLNPPAALEACVDKYLATARLDAAGLPTPPTVVCQRAEDAMTAFSELGGDVVVKPLFGSEGRGMVRVTDGELAWRTFHTLERTNCVLYVQRFIANRGYDLRAFVIGGRIIAAMRRWANAGWRTNVAQGGRAEAIQLSDEEAGLALRAAEVLQAPICGVDLLPGLDGRTYVLEANAVPGWRALAAATGVDVAREVIRHCTLSAAPTAQTGR